LNGEIRFTESSVTANGLDAMLGNEEVTLSIRGSKDDSSDHPARISISGNTSPDFIAKQVLAHFPDLSELTNRLTRELNGSTRWEASLTYAGKPDGTGLNRSLQVRSDLIGMTVTLPEPFSKKGYERTVFELNKNLDADGPQTLSLTYGDVKSEISFSEKEHSRVDRVNIHIGDKGPEIMSGPGPGIYLSGRLERLNINEWTRLLPEEFLSDNLTERLKIRTDLEIGSFELLGQTFSDTVIVAERNNDILNFTVNSPDINGKIILAELQDKERHFILDLDLLTLKKTSEGNGIGRINPARLPAMLVKVKSFKYDELDLGAFNMTAVPTANGLLFENVSFNKPDLDIQANGKWNNNRYTGSASNFFINVHTGEFNLLLETFGFINETIAKAPTRLTINANWPGSPMNFSLAKLNGNITLNMDKGQLLDIQPAAGRLFGLLSLQTLPRRMVLDFSDLFGAGMAFDSISGNFNVKDGNAYTDNLSMKGPSVDIDIRGRTGLSVKDYDQKATVTPQISDSLAVASGFFGPVGIGLGTVLYLAGNMFEPLSDSINKIMKIEYNIKGSWDNPVVEKVTVNQDS
jgi:uncharacterized protein YhdP